MITEEQHKAITEEVNRQCEAQYRQGVPVDMMDTRIIIANMIAAQEQINASRGLL